MRRILVRTDVVHLYFGTSLATINRLPDHPVTGPVAWARRAVSRLFWMRDVPMLKRLGKTVAMTFLGDDVRQVGHMRESRARSHLGGAYGDALAGLDSRKKRLAALAGIHADLIYATTPDLLGVLPARTRFLPSVLPQQEGPARRAMNPFTVAHAPSNMMVKGTAEVEEAMRQLAGDAEPVRFELITNASHAQTLERIGQADIFIDQLKVGWYGVAAVEALAKGCVVLAYLDETDRSHIPPEMNAALPIVPVRNVTEIVSAVRRLRDMPADERAALSRAGIAWTRRWHGEAVAAQVVEDYLHVRGNRG